MNPDIIPVNTISDMPYFILHDAIMKYGAQRYTTHFETTANNRPYLAIDHEKKTLTFMVPK